VTPKVSIHGCVASLVPPTLREMTIVLVSYAWKWNLLRYENLTGNMRQWPLLSMYISLELNRTM
jgi:hypothetical protein